MSWKKSLMEIMAYFQLGTLFPNFFPILLDKQQRIGKICIFGGSFNPPHRGHVEATKILSRFFDEVIVVPCGYRIDKVYPDSKIRQPLLEKAFAAAGVTVDCRRITQKNLDPLELAKYYIQEKKNKDVWVAMGTDVMIKHQNDPQWPEYMAYNWIVLEREGYKLEKPLPPKSKILHLAYGRKIASSRIKKMLAEIAEILPENCTIQDLLQFQ
ncbi:MAG: hypothetical protein G01um101418_485 [Parcubacteria group bacterium Gr01-1014_18]|nr:MAG: hypothetical protein Greene041636_531 [Parcubacteria group bacterium Greene0416_36]TSC81072.1 MAG: hypothetical protein G01um101418_485 [Parcubacteria group bacterium Gr01-1014_18]TSC98806.1 MAG: hypothetical protein Greene101420_556 [Parcubacteria group bacterium Greene1014_20]TSD06714.1 MAG: hypothetical protein Greene07142_635 [Parcubacteria group bacterium Greene0714_2]